MFRLAAELERDSIYLDDWPLCRLLLANDARYPWVILVPRRSEIRELYELEAADQQQLWRESTWLGRGLMGVFAGDKLNVAALGNQVPQLHLHHVVRFFGDPAWPAPVWGKGAASPYSRDRLREVGDLLRPIIEGLTP